VRRRVTVAVVMLVAIAVPSAPLTARQDPNLPKALTKYANADFDGAYEYLSRVANLKVLQSDLEQMSQEWLKGKVLPARTARRAMTGFALEAAATHMADANAPKLVEWACRIIRDDGTPDAYDRAWQLAALGIMEGAAQPKLLQAHLDHVKSQVDDPRFVLAAAIADDQRTSPLIAKSGLTSGEALAAATSALKKYDAAATIASLAPEAHLRAGYLELRLNKTDEALHALEVVDYATHDPVLVYLARLFRGQLYEHMGRLDDARDAYQAALQIVPGAHAATIATAALLARQDRRIDANDIVTRMLVDDRKVDDPWWGYWAGDFRFRAVRIDAMREAMAK
jgi:tetratricopeptide (TPR) repeat protein